MILEAINGRYLTGGCLLSASLFTGLFLSLQHIRLTTMAFAIFRKRSEISASEAARTIALSACFRKNFASFTIARYRYDGSS
jgi:hypothetical protein